MNELRDEVAAAVLSVADTVQCWHEVEEGIDHAVFDCEKLISAAATTVIRDAPLAEIDRRIVAIDESAIDLRMSSYNGGRRVEIVDFRAQIIAMLGEGA